MLQMRVSGKHEPQHGGQQQQQWEQRHETEVGDQRGEVATGIIEVLVEHCQRKTRTRMAALEPVQPRLVAILVLRMLATRRGVRRNGRLNNARAIAHRRFHATTLHDGT